MVQSHIKERGLPAGGSFPAIRGVYMVTNNIYQVNSDISLNTRTLSVPAADCIVNNGWRPVYVSQRMIQKACCNL